VFRLVCLTLTVAAPAAAEIRTVYVIPFTHWDRGFVTNPEDILPRLKPHLDEVIDLAAADPEYRWTIESIWQLNEWLQRTEDPKRVQMLRELVQRGQIEISGAYGSMHTEFMDSEELNLITQDSFRMARALGIDLPQLMVMDDVPGYSQRMPQVLAASRVRYLLAGANLFIGGGTSLAPGNVPFYWQGPDGSKVLTWVSQGKSGGYVEGMQEYYVAPTTPDPYGNLPSLLPPELQGKPPLEVMERGMKRLRETYEGAGYAYDAVLVMYVHDFVPATFERDHLLPAVRKWNASGRQPQLKVATPKEFFDYILSKYSAQIPTYKGDWAGLWSEVKTNSPGIDALARQVQLDLRASNLLWAWLRLAQGLEYPSGNILDSYRKLWNYDEHSGAGQTGWPKLMTVQQVNDQNRDYVKYVRDALKDQKWLTALAMRRILETGPGVADGLAVFQPWSWAFDSVIRIPASPSLKRSTGLRDPGTGKVIPVQWSEEEGTAVAALPATSLVFLEPAPSLPGRPAGVSSLEHVLENPYYRLELRAKDGAVLHLIDRESGKELVNTSARKAFNQLLWSVEFKEAEVPSGRVRIRRERGPVYDALVVRRAAGPAPVTEYRLYHALKRLEVRNLLDRSRMPVVSGIAPDQFHLYQFAFPLLPGASVETLQYENGNGMVTFPRDYLPGARQDAVVTHGVVVRAGDLNLSVASPEAFYWNLPNLEKQGWRLWENTLLSTVWRKSDGIETRDAGYYMFPTVEPGLSDHRWFTYAISSWTGPPQDGTSFRRLWESIAVPVVSFQTGDGRTAGRSLNPRQLFATDTPDVVILSAAASWTRPGGVVLRLQEISGKPQSATIRLPAQDLGATMVDLTEAPVGAGALKVAEGRVSLDVPAHATVSILLARKSERTAGK
jgi:hypothetical protein